jgi:hypothetical protein
MGTGQTLCAACGHPLAEGAMFCGQCGTTRLPGEARLPLASTEVPSRVGAQTLLQMARPAPAAPPDEPRVQAPGPPVRAMQKTMLGMPTLTPEQARDLGSTSPHLPVPSQSPLNRTMVGVAMPGIAPTRPPSETAPPPAILSQSAPVTPPHHPPRQNLSLTVPLQVSYVPPPEPLRELLAPPPPHIVRRRGGLSLAGAALLTGAILLAGGVALAVFWRGAPPIGGQPRTTPDGKDVLHLVCDPKSCKDGTVVALGGSKTSFMAGEANLLLLAPLQVGDNTLELMVDRPGMGRDEMVRLVVPVAYRVSADISTMSGPRPAITVRIQARPGSEATVDGKPVKLDSGGAGMVAIDESAATEGPADESRVVSVDVPYTVATGGHAPESGTVSARAAVAPLRVDAPGASAIVEEDKVLVAGRAARGAAVTVAGNPVTVAPDGAFETMVPLPAEGDVKLDVRGGTGTLVPRTVHVAVSRVASLAEAARAFEQQKPLGYDAVMSDVAGKIGQPVVVDGEVLEARGAGHRTLALVDDRRGCAASPCLTRVVVGRDLALVRGERLRAYGRVARAFTTPSGRTIPEVESLFVLPTKR